MFRCKGNTACVAPGIRETLECGTAGQYRLWTTVFQAAGEGSHFSMRPARQDRLACTRYESPPARGQELGLQVFPPPGPRLHCPHCGRGIRSAGAGGAVCLWAEKT